MVSLPDTWWERSQARYTRLNDAVPRITKRQIFLITSACLTSLALLWMINSRDTFSKARELSIQYTSTILTLGKARPDTSPDFKSLLRAMYKPFLIPETQTWFFSPNDRVNYTTNGHSHWDKPLGKRLGIFCMDSRAHTEPGHIFNEEMNWETLANPSPNASPGLFNHFMYAAIHDYDYHYIKLPKYTVYQNRHDVWAKIPALASVLPHYDIVVMLDPDAVFMHLAMPYNFLLNRWNFTFETSIAAPNDTAYFPDGSRVPNMFDSHDNIRINAGFITAQNIPKTFEIIKAWDSCPDNEERFPGCSALRQNWPGEQGALGDHIRYDPEFNKTTDVLAFDGSDGNGFPWNGMDVSGRFIRHFTTGKGFVKSAVAEITMQSFMTMSQAQFFDPDGGMTVDRHSNRFTEDIEGLIEKTGDLAQSENNLKPCPECQSNW